MQQLSGFTDRISTVLVMLTHMTQMTRMIRISSMTDSEDPESVKGSGFAISSSWPVPLHLLYLERLPPTLLSHNGMILVCPRI